MYILYIYIYIYISIECRGVLVPPPDPKATSEYWIPLSERPGYSYP